MRKFAATQKNEMQDIAVFHSKMTLCLEVK